MRQRFCSVAQAMSSSQRQWNLQPSAHFSTSILQRGTTHQLPVGVAEGCPAEPGVAEGPPKVPRSSNKEVDMHNPFLGGMDATGNPSERASGHPVGDLTNMEKASRARVSEIVRTVRAKRLKRYGL